MHESEIVTFVPSTVNQRVDFTMKLNHITLIVSDFERSTTFYRTLGLIPIVHEPPRYARFQCPDSDATLSVEVTGQPPALPRAQLYFECADLDRTVAHLKEKDLVFWQDPTDMDYLWREARLKDPDGHEVRLYFADDNCLNPSPGNPCMHRTDKQSIDSFQCYLPPITLTAS